MLQFGTLNGENLGKRNFEMLNLLKPFWLSIVKYAAIVGGILLVVFKIRQSGRDAERAENIEKVVENVQIRHDVERSVNSFDNASGRLRKKWTRKE